MSEDDYSCIIDDIEFLKIKFENKIDINELITYIDLLKSRIVEFYNSDTENIFHTNEQIEENNFILIEQQSQFVRYLKAIKAPVEQVVNAVDKLKKLKQQKLI